MMRLISAYTISAFDDCGGHINPFDGYHLHGARGTPQLPPDVAPSPITGVVGIKTVVGIGSPFSSHSMRPSTQ
jgi:hypothetical protein